MKVERTNFEVGDACSLREDLGQFDLVLLANLICRLPEPLKCLNRLLGSNSLVKQGGYLVITTPFSWLEDFTNPENWLGSATQGAPESFAKLNEVLSAEYELIENSSFPFLIREHRRKYQLVYPQLTIWRKK